MKTYYRGALAIAAVVIVVLLGAGLFGGFEDPRAGQKAPWPEIPFEAAEQHEGDVSFDAREPLRYIDVVSAASPRHADHHLLLERLKLLVELNVDSGVGIELDRLFRNHTIHYLMSTRMDGEIAAFYVEDGQAKMAVDAYELASLGNQGQIIRMQGVVAHEFVHYKQWEAETDPFVRSTFETGFDKTDPRICPIMWEHEREAYHYMCGIYNDNGITNTNRSDPQNMCIRTKLDAAFDQAYYHYMSSNDARAELCDDIWWDLAGGPRF